MSDSLSGAIVQAFQGNAACVSAFPGGIWEGEAVEATSLPFVVLDLPQGTTDLTSSSIYIEHCPCVFTIRVASLANAESAAAVLRTFLATPGLIVFDRAILLKLFNRSPNVPTPEMQRDENGNTVYQIQLHYEALVQRSN